MAGQIAGAMKPDVPMAFFGHSMGATLAFEVALRLRRNFPASVTRLFVSARRAPADCHPTGRAFLDDDVLMRVMRRPGAPPLSEEEWAVLGPPLRNDLLMAERYRHRPGPRLTCPITAITAREDPTGCTEPEARRWADYTIGSFDAHVMPGDHLYLEDDPVAVAGFLATKLGRLISSVQR
jgi:surfactin synthase thioesterase subunit